MRRATSLLALLALIALPVFGAKVADVRATKHNFSATATGRTTGTAPDRTVKAPAGGESQVCVFCHTPHGASKSAGTDINGNPIPLTSPLWNRQISGATYTNYTSTSLDADVLQTATSRDPNGSSKLCLSCHDGTIAIGSVNVLSGKQNQTIALDGTNGGMMPDPSATTPGSTRFLDVDLSNDHPISVTYNQALADRDGELRWPLDNSVVAVRNHKAATPSKPDLPLEATDAAGDGQVQCATCHDPHLYDTEEATKGPQKFLRQNRFQEVTPTGSHQPDSDIICLSCHDRDKGNGSWAFSAHANPTVANETYAKDPAAAREFPENLPVWKAACLNCHDTHTVPGARRLLRNGTVGTSPALEQTCYQCHGNTTVLNDASSVPNVQKDFELANGYRMPIAKTDEVHNIDVNYKDQISIATAGGGSIIETLIDCQGSTDQCGKDFLEPQSRLGYGNLDNRHAECTDCHNPHRVIRNANGLPGALTTTNTTTANRTHRHTNTNDYVHSNVISGALRGSWGVEPIYSSPSFHDMPTDFDVKRGDPGGAVDTGADKTYVTREYQVCLKCHSNYGYADDNVYPNSSNRPQLGTPGTGQNANGHANYTSYTNQAKEFQAPAAHAKNPGSVSLGTEAGAHSDYNANNHRSWHPVMRPTGRTGRATGGFLTPWNNTGAIGNQTMYCSDCHGAAISTSGTAIPPTGVAWGPHGSSNAFLLKGDWSTTTGEGQQNEGLCFKCHNYNRYAGTSGGTGFQTTDRGDGHAYHSTKIDTQMKCNFCHVAVPHGWKNRNLLVNLNDVGPEAGLPAGTKVWQSSMNNGGGGYSNGPYYRHAYLRISSFPSGSWSESNCNGGKDGMISNCENPQ